MISSVMLAATPQNVGLNPMTGVYFGATVMAALLVLKIIDFFLEKAKSQKNDIDTKEIISNVTKSFEAALAPVATSMTEIKESTKDTQDKMVKSWALHNKFDEDGRPRWYIPHTLPEVLSEVSKTCERIVSSQCETLKAFRDTAQLQQEILQNQKQFLTALQNFQAQQSQVQNGLNLIIQQVMAGRGSQEIIPPIPPNHPQG